MFSTKYHNNSKNNLNESTLASLNSVFQKQDSSNFKVNIY